MEDNFAATFCSCLKSIAISTALGIDIGPSVEQKTNNTFVALNAAC